MKSRTLIFITAMTLLAALAMPVRNVAQEEQPPQAEHLQHYTVTDLGTLGGSFSLAYEINNRGQVDGFSTLPGDAVVHSFVMEDGVMTDLGTLGGPNSQSFAGLNEATQVAGSAEKSARDPYGEDFGGFGTHLVCLGFLWQNGVMTPLDTLGGNNGQAAEVNDRGQVAGYAENSTRDPGCPAPQVLQFRPVTWTEGEIRRLPMFPGDSEGAAFWINDTGEVVGASGSCAAYDPRYGLPLQPQHAVLWSHGKVIDLGNLGGKINNAAFSINDRGEIIGASDLPGDTFQHAFLWRKGVMADLGTLPGDVVSAAIGINNRGQVVGVSTDANGNLRAFLWQNGVMTDLNSLIPTGSPLYLLHGFGINSAGQIVGFALQTETGQVHAFLATPKDGEEDSESAGLAAQRETSESEKVALPENVRRLLQRRLSFGQFGTRPTRPR